MEGFVCKRLLLFSKMELSSLYLKSGLKNVGIMFLMTDAQVPYETFLVLINDMLASGEIPDLFPDDEMENIIGGVRNEVTSFCLKKIKKFLLKKKRKKREKIFFICRSKELEF